MIVRVSGKKRLLLLPLLLGMLPTAPAVEQESLGNPVRSGELIVAGYTRGADQSETAWARVMLPERRGILGIDCKSGKTTWVDLAKYGTHLQLLRVHPNGKAYALVKNTLAKDKNANALLVEYDPATGKQREIPLPVRGDYFMPVTGDIAPDGTIFVGTYPEVQLAWFNPETGKSGGTKRLSSDARQKYVLYLLSDKDGKIYFTVGLHHPELFCYDPVSGASRQLLPEKFAKSTIKGRIYRGTDGQVYAQYGKEVFRCFPDRVEPVDALPALEFDKPYTFPGNFTLADGRQLLSVDSEGVLSLSNPATGKIEEIPTDFPAFSPLVYSICPGLNGTIWVGSFSPAALASFTHGEAKPEYTNYGKRTSGSTQIYWAHEYPDRVYLSSYVGGSIDRMDKNHDKFKKVVRLSGKEQQERVFMLIPGPDGKLYGPTMPIKGHLGGGIVVVDPENDTYRFYRNVVDQQSLRALAATPDGLIFGVSDINGGTSAIPTAREAKIFLWDPATKKVVWDAAPLKGEKYYLGAYPLGGSRFWTVGVTSRKVVVVDTARRTIEKTIELPRRSGLRPLGSAPVLGDRAYLLLGDGLYEVDIAGEKVTKLFSSPEIEAKFVNSLHGTHAEYMAPDGTVYFGSQSGLYRIRLK